MAKGRKKLPTKIKELQGTSKKERILENEMQVETVDIIPKAPKWLSKIGKAEWEKVCFELFNKKMLHHIDLILLESYCNAISLHIEMETKLRKEGRIQIYKNPDGSSKHAQAKPHQKIANEALDRALKIATQFGFTPSARSSINQPNLKQTNNEFNFFS